MRQSSMPAWFLTVPWQMPEQSGTPEPPQACAVTGTARTEERSHGWPTWMSWCKDCMITSLVTLQHIHSWSAREILRSWYFLPNASWTLPLLCFQRPSIRMEDFGMPQNHRMVEVGTDLRKSSCQTHCSRRATLSQLPRTVSRQLLNTRPVLARFTAPSIPRAYCKSEVTSQP